MGSRIFLLNFDLRASNLVKVRYEIDRKVFYGIKTHGTGSCVNSDNDPTRTEQLSRVIRSADSTNTADIVRGANRSRGTAFSSTLCFQSLKLRQVTDGVHFIQLIYSGDGVLRDCEYIRQRQAVRSFLESVREAVDSRGNVTSLDGKSLPLELAEWMDYPLLKEQCRRIHRKLKRLARRKMHGTEHQKRRANKDIERYVVS
ncbi:hypothetical protein J6590_100414, partial [Homalodisca vitripennis]